MEKMVESLMARGYGSQYPYHLRPSPDIVGPMDRKEIAELQARHKADMARKHELEAKEIDKMKERARHEAARAVDQAKRAAVDAEKIARAEQKRQPRRIFKEGSQKQLDDLRKRLEILEREREMLEHQIEELERNEEQLDEPRDEEQDSDQPSDTLESNSDSPSRQ